MAEMPMGGAMAMDERHLELKVVSLETGKHEAKPPQKMLFPL